MTPKGLKKHGNKNKKKRMFTFLIKILVESTSNIALSSPPQSFGIQKATETITMDRYIKLTSILFPISGKNSKTQPNIKLSRS